MRRRRSPRTTAGGLVAVGLAFAVLSPSADVRAGGYDTPMLYSARHMGMGGTAVAYVRDPSALFHNPAGLAHVERGMVLGDFSLLLGNVKGSPAARVENIDSNTAVAPFFLVGGAYRITDWLVAGLAVYPVATAAATYEYETPGGPGTNTVDRTRLVFIEASPGLAVNLDEYRLRLGAGYRVTYVTLNRLRQVDDDPGVFDFSMTGFDFLSFRAGAQWEAIEDHLSVGVSYRHRTAVRITNDEGIALPGILTPDGRLSDIEAEFILPARLAFGLRGDFNSVGMAVDVEYGFNSQNRATVLSGFGDPSDPDTRIEAANIFRWDDQLTLRFGTEYRWALGPNPQDGAVTPRVGYIFDAKTANPQYPTAFGTPPGPTHVVTLGAGYDAGPWQANVAYAHRFGSGQVTADDLAGATELCAFCGQAGDYQLTVNGYYVDFSYEF